MKYRYTGEPGLNPAVIGHLSAERLLDESDFLDTIQFLLWKENGLLVPADQGAVKPKPLEKD